ncbi:riboflavin synthase [Candidatus Liberibacter asiaticus]|uniref:Riboflavin synthase n=2 Tax=Liberibacter asiaticus TaxID=34021 RepID=C6XHS7_LIBAP|nr:riboflavin synthase [Candidatus Liberibacter asiaticus]ACT56820.1 riboflavin synthase subunit alpha [Candidatus Liberibacter asiaticus str. psy62]AGH16587.1 riboflavin synthase subunit alpha [Candidatus Liberibacter asiaticus str. gxpsy]ALK06978.1 riboflavin synthase [Candidatus Liberibacter asiaticus]ASK52448.1 riboflavin synthase [Candidatus Liberibacter asiaticus]AWL13775.1 riboflavin synthase [Candidatus Liberibacter asiaticus]
MFTGIVTDIGKIIAMTPIAKGMRLRVMTSYNTSKMKLGCSIAHAGICLTVVRLSEEHSVDNWYEVEVWAETNRITNIASWGIGTFINLERSVKLGDRLDGHLVSGHIDGTVEILFLDFIGDSMYCRLSLPHNLEQFIAVKGSVCLNGVSLTVNLVGKNFFDVLLIRHTIEETTWKMHKVGDLINIEVDSMMRYIARLYALNTSQ